MNQIEPARRLVHFDDIPDELLLEIFKWIPFDDLSSRVKLVSRRWSKVASTASLHPRVLVITKQSNPKKVHHILWKYGDTLSTIKFLDIYDSRTMASLNSRLWSNLRRISMKWKHHSILDSARIPVTYINWVIDRSPRLIGIELRECYIYGDMDVLLDKLQNRRISELTFMNSYLVVNGIEKLFGLRDMAKFRVCCYPLGNFRSRICTFCTNNRHSLTSLALRIDGQSARIDDVVAAITSCTMLRKLHLIGRFSVSNEAFRSISQLHKLKCLKIQVHGIESDELARFLNSSFARQITVLAVHWSRPASRDELTGIVDCKNLASLTLMFSDNFNDVEMIRDVVIEIVKKLKLKKLKIISGFEVIDLLPEICLQSEDLFNVKLIHSYQIPHLKQLKNKMRSINALYEYEYSVHKCEMQITLRKRVNTQVDFLKIN